MAANDIQHETMRVYRALVDLREDWAGRLVLCCGTGCVSGGAPTAISIAGGATLAIDSDAAPMKAAMRAGRLDFVVSSLDEALRALKNEVRKRRPLSVGLIANVDVTRAEMVERGVQPDLQVVSGSGPDLAGIEESPMGLAFGPQPTSARLHDFCQNHLISNHLIFNRSIVDEGHSEYFFASGNVAELAMIDAALLAAIAADDVVRRRWVQGVPRYLREARNGGRWIWLSDEERERLDGLSVGQR